MSRLPIVFLQTDKSLFRFHYALLSACVGLLLAFAAQQTHAEEVSAETLSAGEVVRTVLLVPMKDKPSAQDMVFLSAVPAATVANNGIPVVIALPPSGEIERELSDYLRRYKPGIVYTLGNGVKVPEKTDCPWKAIASGSAVSTAAKLARTFWKSSETVVVCQAQDYTAALVAATLAARERVPLLFSSEKGLHRGAARQLKRLGASKILFVGENKATAKSLEKYDAPVTQLNDAKDVLAWLKKEGKKGDYIAAVNPTDRNGTVIKKLSLAGVLLAAGREGMVIPLEYNVRWKTPFTGETLEKDLPKGIPATRSKILPRKGVIQLDDHKYTFVTTGGLKAGPHRLYVDLDGNGAFDDSGEGPLATADKVTLGKKEYAITLGEKSGVGTANLRLTWPTADYIRSELKTHYDILSSHPEYLCLVGFPDAIPHAVIPREPGRFGDILSDMPFANVDDDPFSEICVARLIGANVQLATLYASRVLTYCDLLDPEWQGSVGEARWENTYQLLFENVGFSKRFRHDIEDLQWIVKPGPKPEDKGKRAKDFDSNSPLTRVAAMTHLAHSWWKDLGQTFSWDSTVLMAPTLVESGGCLTCTLDREPDFRSVVSRLFRNGAVGFVGNIRPGMANQEQQRMEFWNSVLAGKTAGEAHRNAQNSMMLTVLDTDQTKSGNNHYSLHIRSLFGDPAFTMHVPSKPQSKPACITTANDTVSVHGPAKWWPVGMRVPEDWKLWKDKDLYVCRGAGTYPVRFWCREQYDREETYVNAEIRTNRQIKNITQVQELKQPLGWNGKYWVDEHADGTRTYRWRVRLIDFDQIKGEILSKADRIDYRIQWKDN